MYRGYFPVIPDQNSHKECFEIGQWDTDIDQVGISERVANTEIFIACG